MAPRRGFAAVTARTTPITVMYDLLLRERTQKGANERDEEQWDRVSYFANHIIYAHHILDTDRWSSRLPIAGIAINTNGSLHPQASPKAPLTNCPAPTPMPDATLNTADIMLLGGKCASVSVAAMSRLGCRRRPVGLNESGECKKTRSRPINVTWRLPF